MDDKTKSKGFNVGFIIGFIGLVVMDQGEGVLGDVGAMLCCSGFLLAVFSGYHPLFSRNQQQYAVGMMPLQQPNSQNAMHEHVNQTSISQTNMTQPMGADESRQDVQPIKLDVNNPSKDDEGEKKSNFWDNI